MTTWEPLDRSLSALFTDEALAAAPSDLADRIVARTARLRPRPGWRARIDQAGFDRPRLRAPAGEPVARVWILLVVALAAAAALVGATLLLDRAPIIRGVFEPAGTLSTPGTIGLLLPDGRIVVFGGEVAAQQGLGSLGGSPEAILLYDPVAGTSTEIGTTSASVSGAVPLADGRVFAIELAPSPPGGGSGGGSTASVIDPARGQIVALGATTQSHLFGGAVRLRDGRVLLVGDASGTTDAELFDPATGTFAATGSTSNPMMQPSATLLADGRVLVVGDREPVAELYDPSTGTFTRTGPMSSPREAFTATLLGDGRVAVVGGWATNGTVIDGMFYPSEPERLGTTAEIFDASTGRFSQVGPMLTSRVHHFAVLLRDGRLLIGGGSNAAGTDVLEAEILDPAMGNFSATGSLSTARFGAGAVLLPDGHVLVIGSVPPLGAGSAADPLDASSLEIFQ